MILKRQEKANLFVKNKKKSKLTDIFVRQIFASFASFCLFNNNSLMDILNIS